MTHVEVRKYSQALKPAEMTNDVSEANSPETNAKSSASPELVIWGIRVQLLQSLRGH